MSTILVTHYTQYKQQPWNAKSREKLTRILSI
jgi:hypothetical protein